LGDVISPRVRAGRVDDRLGETEREWGLPCDPIQQSMRGCEVIVADFGDEAGSQSTVCV
jgi:hypothetical protein